MDHLDGYRDFVAGRMDGWRRTAHALCGNWHLADDLVSIVLGKLFRHWTRISAVEHPDAYVRQMLVRALLDERRRSARREHPVETLPERPAVVDGPEAGVDRQFWLSMLSELPPGRREVIVLRYLCDLSVEETAARLGCSPSSVKSQTFRAIGTLRTRVAART